MENITLTAEYLKQNVSDWGLGFLKQNCTGKDYYTIECLNKNFCPQISDHLINWGMRLVIIYFIVNIATSLFIGHGERLMKDRNKRVDLALTIYENMSLILIMYIATAIYLNL